MVRLTGTFASDCEWQPKNYCTGKCYVDVDHFDRHADKMVGVISIEYDKSSTFQPPCFIPKPTPAMPVTSKRSIDMGAEWDHTLTVTTSFFRPWEKIFDMIGMQVDYNYKDDKIVGRYYINGGFGIPRDAGTIIIPLDK